MRKDYPSKSVQVSGFRVLPEGIDRRDFLRQGIAVTVGLVATACGVKVEDDCGKMIAAKDLTGPVFIAGTDEHFDPTSFDTSGKPSMSPDCDVVARTWGTWTFTYEVGKGGMAEGGGLRVITPTGYVLWWSKPQDIDPKKPGYLRGRTSNSKVQIRTCKWMPEWGSKGFAVDVIKGHLKPGDRIIVTWGEGNTTQAQHSALKNIPFRFTTDLNGDGMYQECRWNPTFDVLPDRFDHIRVTARTDAQMGRPHRIHAGFFDQWHNAVDDLEGVFEVEYSASDTRGPRQVRLRSSDKGVLAFDVALMTKGWHSVTLKSTNGKFVGKSTPIRVANKLPDRPLFWGDIHGHTNVSDGAGTIDEYYTYGRDVANLDICALTDHGSRICATSDIEWKLIQEAVRRYSDPGRFVTFLGYEYTAMRPRVKGVLPKLGHRNVYYLGDAEPVRRFMDPKYDIYEKVWRELKQTEGMTIAHHCLVGAFAQNWDYIDPECECLVEIYSYHGNSEYQGCPKQCGHDPEVHDVSGSSVLDALRRGYKLGFIGSGDNHQCHPGYAFTRRTNGGCLAVYARQLTRESVWSALKARRCYATSERGIVVDFNVNGYPMGSDIRDSGLRRIEGLVKGTAPLKYVRITKNGAVWKEIDCAGKDLVEFDVEDTPSPSGTDFYYLRIGQTNTQLAWSSPIWVEAGEKKTGKISSEQDDEIMDNLRSLGYIQ